MVGHRRRARILAVALGAFVATALILGFERDRGWVRIGSLEAVAKAHVVHVSNLGLFVVAAAPIPIALSARSPHGGEPVSFCTADQTFLDAAGDVFDRSGRLIAGPSSTGLGRFAVRIRNGFVDVRPGALVAPSAGAVADRTTPPRVGACRTPVSGAPAFLSPAP